jgi:PAS domain-containing protein
LETTVTPTAGAAQPELAAAFAAWSRLPTVAAALGARDSVHLVVDPGTGQVLYASAAAMSLADALTGPASAGVTRQIAAATAQAGAPRLARLRLDPRRITPPVLCWLARGSQADGRDAVLVVPTAPLAPPRTRPARPAEPPATEPAAPSPEIANAVVQPRRGDRFLWRIDAAGLLTTLTGPDALAGLVGQRWQDLAETGRITGADAALAAVRERRTFRGEPAIFDGGAGPIQVELSGAPLGRGAAAFSGFAGFGLIRSAPGTARPPAEALERPPERPAPEPAAEAGVADERVRSEPEASDEAIAPPTLEALRAADPEPFATALSNDEHAAFREIARALGARYAGDEAEAGPRTAKAEGGAVMPFPTPQAPSAEMRAVDEEPAERVVEAGPADAANLEQPPEPDTPQASEFLAGLPLPALIHRDGVIVAANRRLLDLTGHADLPDLVRTGIVGLLPGAGQEAGPAERRTAVATADGGARPVEILSGPCRWAGAAAMCLIVRPVAEADVADALDAERLARAAQAERTASAEAALDALMTGVVTVDGAGRIVALNRAATGLFGCEPREIVGGSFVALFDRPSVLTVADALRGATSEPGLVHLAGEPVRLDVTAPRADGRRVVLLERRAGDGSVPDAPHGADMGPAPARDGALDRLDRAFRAPLTGMIELADAMLKEPFGPLGDARYRGCLAEIKVSGETMLERVGKLLDLAAVEAGSLHLEPRPLDLNDVVANCVARLQADAARGRIVMRTSFSTDLGDLEADERSVSRAASLVIENAIRRSAAGGQIIVSTGSAERAAVALRVRDSSAGAALRMDDPKADVEDGLALPRALVEANGGRLQLSARSEDGTLVEIIMPTRRAANG